MEALLHRTMGFDEPKMRVHRQVLCHGYVCVELYSWRMKMSRFTYGTIYQQPSKTFTLPRWINVNVVDEVSVNFGPSNHIAGDRTASLNHHDMSGRNLSSKIGNHGCGLAAYVADVLGVSSTSDRANASSGIR
jgi:hypothetical protein